MASSWPADSTLKELDDVLATASELEVEGPGGLRLAVPLQGLALPGWLADNGNTPLLRGGGTGNTP